MWSNGNAPSVESLTTCTAGLGAPCPSGASKINMAQSNCVSLGIKTVDGSASYDSWTGSSSLYYPIGSVPPVNSTIGLTFSDTSWGLLTDTNILAFGGQLLVMTSRCTNNGLFNRTPRSSVAANVTIWPDCGGESFQNPVSDPDFDPFKCRWSNSTYECRECCHDSIIQGYSYYYNYYYLYSNGAPYPFNLSSNCTLTYTGRPVTSKTY